MVVILLVTSLPANQEASAQNAVLTGTVWDTTTENPLPGVLVTCLDEQPAATTFSAVSNDLGIFRITDIEAGAYILTASHPGYEEFRIEVQIAPGKERTVEIHMESWPIELDPVVVSASRYEETLLLAPASISVISSHDLAREGVPSVVATFRTVPGVDFQQAGINRFLIAVRGFNNAFSSNTYTLVDHREAFNPALGLVAYSSLPIDALDIDRIEVVRGPGSALYGLGVEQGVIHFLTKNPFTHPSTSLAFGVGTQAMLQGAFRHAGVFKDKLGYKITGSYMQAEDWKLDPDDLDHDKVILDKIIPELTNLDGEVERVIDGRDYEAYSWKLDGYLEYRFDDDTRLSGFAGYMRNKQILNASLGEIQVDGAGMLTAQVKFESGPFRAQAYGVQEFVDGNNWFYRQGELMYGRSSEINLQAQYKLALWENQEPIIVGADYKLTTPRSSGTISGRFEDEDTFSTSGVYVHSVTRVAEKLHLTASGRIDYIGATGNTVFSPRVGLVYQSEPEHTYRLTYNRAYSRPTATDYFGDLQVGRDERSPPRFNVRFMGSEGGFNFPDPPLTSTFFGTGRDTGIGVATARAYGNLADDVAEQLQADDPGPLTNFLRNKESGIEGFSEGFMTFRSSDAEKTREQITDTFELGYKGVWRDQFLVGIDGYYTRKSESLFTHVITPFVVVPGEILSRDLQKAVLDAFTDEELAPFGIDAATLASAYVEQGPTLGYPNLVGILELEQNYNPDTLPELVMANINAGSLDYFGVDLSIEAFLSERWSAFANYSWVSDNFFDSEDLGLPGTGFDVSMNAPKGKFRTGVTYRSKLGFSVSGSLRYVSSFRVADGRNYNGTVESYTLVDVGLAYDFTGLATGLTLAITAQNIFDNEHREYIGFPTIGRMVSSRLTYTF